jgi:hypothetical protein
MTSSFSNAEPERISGEEIGGGFVKRHLNLQEDFNHSK